MHTLLIWLGVLSAPASAEQLAAVQPASKFAPAPAAQTTAWRLSSGFDVMRGDYGASRATTLSYAPVGLSYTMQYWTFGLDTGYIDVTGPVSFIDVADLGLTAGEADALGFNGDTTAQGFDNVTLSARAAAYEDWRRNLLIDLTARVSLPTASQRKGLGTGAVDTAFGIEATQLAGRTTWFSSLVYKIRGGAEDRRNSWSAGFGFDRALAQRWSWGMSYDARQSGIRGGPLTYDLTLFTTLNLGGASITAYAVTGLPRDHAGSGAGLRISTGF